MRFFIDSEPGKGLRGDDNLRIGLTKCYIELEVNLQDSYMILYYIPKGNNSFIIATCWERVFDDILENIDDEDYVDTLVHTWPTLAELLSNGSKDKYSEGALIKLEDFDDGEPKWFLASIVGNIDIEDVSDMLDGRAGATAKLVIRRTVSLWNELNNKKPSTMRAVLKGVGKGVATGLGTVIAAYWGIDPDDFC